MYDGAVITYNKSMVTLEDMNLQATPTDGVS